jgi:hypothetical protein
VALPDPVPWALASLSVSPPVGGGGLLGDRGGGGDCSLQNHGKSVSCRHGVVIFLESSR